MQLIHSAREQMAANMHTLTHALAENCTYFKTCAFCVLHARTYQHTFRGNAKELQRECGLNQIRY